VNEEALAKWRAVAPKSNKQATRLTSNGVKILSAEGRKTNMNEQVGGMKWCKMFVIFMVASGLCQSSESKI